MNNIAIMLECSCGIILPVNRTYFCRHCLKIRCPVCSEQDILSYYCDHCFAGVSDSIVQSNEGKCLTCYDCPHCFNHLTLRAKRKKNASAQDVLYYLTCSFCLWSTHEIDFPDQRSIASFCPPTKNESILNLIDYHKAVHWNQASLLAHNLPVNITRAEPSVAEENFDMLPVSIFGSSVNLSKVTNVSQRLADPSVQPNNSNELKPIRKQLKTVKLLRCLQCSHNLRLPEGKAAYFFKVNRNCFYYVPQLKVVKFDPLRYDSLSEIILEVTNCFPYNISVHFFQNLGSPKGILNASLEKNVDVIIFPKIPILLPPKFKAHSSNENDGVKVRFLIQPNILANIGDDSVFSFVMQYSYLNRNVQIPEIVRLDCKVFINLGKLTVL